MNDKNPSNPLAERFRMYNKEIPSHCIFNKVVTGCGATSLEIENLDRNSIIAVPFRCLVDNKVIQYPNKRTGRKFELFGVYGGVTSAEVEDYLERNRGHKNKFIVVWDKLPDLTGYIESYNRKYKMNDPVPLNEYFLLVDEVHVMLNKYLQRRDAIQGVLRIYNDFNDWCFLTATPNDEDFVLEELNGVEVKVAKEMEQERVELKNIKVTRLATETVGFIKAHLDGREITNAHFFVNSVHFIEKVVKDAGLNKENCKIVWGKDNKDYPNDVCGINRGKPEEEPKKINFYTSTCFEGCDIYDQDGRTYIISDSYRKYTLNDVHTTLRQITGRIRNTRYKSPIYHLYRECIYSTDDMSYEDYRARAKAKAEDAKRIAQTLNECRVFDEEEEILNKHYITKLYTTDGKFNYEPNLFRHDLLNYKITHDDYLNPDAVIKSQERAGLIPRAMKRGNYPSDGIKTRKIFKDAFLEFAELEKNPSLDQTGERRERLKGWHKNLEEACRELGPIWVESVDYNTQTIQRELDYNCDLKHRKEIQDILVRKLRDLDIHFQPPWNKSDNFITNELCAQILEEAYREVGIYERKAVKGTSIRQHYFEVTQDSIWKDGKRIHGYYLHSSKEL